VKRSRSSTAGWAADAAEGRVAALARRLGGFTRLMQTPADSPRTPAERWARRRADTQQQFTQAARVNAMGELAVTLAHELNQPLAAISAYAAAAQRAAQGSDPELLDLLRKMEDQAARAAEIVARIREGVHKGGIDAAPLALPELVAEAIDLAMAEIARESVVLLYDFDDAAQDVLADRIQVQQVVVNLVRNALEAMADVPWRELRVGATAEGDFVRVHVTDSGPGVSADVADRLFQPFVSDKPQGMGVGLSISRGIVEAHGGRMWWERASGGGAAFYFTLRRAPQPRPSRETRHLPHATPRLRPAGP
jgi:two-component system sensor kinase FixL